MTMTMTPREKPFAPKRKKWEVRREDPTFQYLSFHPGRQIREHFKIGKFYFFPRGNYSHSADLQGETDFVKKSRHVFSGDVFMVTKVEQTDSGITVTIILNEEVLIFTVGHGQMLPSLYKPGMKLPTAYWRS